MNDIHTRFSSIRAKTGLNRKQFADSLGIVATVVSDIESAKREPSKDVLLKLSQVYSVDLNWMLTGEVRDYERKPGESTDDTTSNPFDVREALSEFQLAKRDSENFTPIRIPIYNQRVSAGPGQAQVDEEIEGYLELETVMPGLKNGVSAVRVAGASMEGAGLFDGDWVMVDTKAEKDQAGVYVISIDGEVYVKRLVMDRLAGTVRVFSMLEDGPKLIREFGPESLESLTIVGRVVGSLRAHVGGF